MLPRRFALIRHIDYTGVSGIGVVAYGVTFADGHVVLRWCSTHPATSMWNSMDDLLAVHGHGEATSVGWIDAPYGDLEDLAARGTGLRGRRRADRASGAAREETPASAPEPLPRRRPAAPPTATGSTVPADPRAAGRSPAGRVMLDQNEGAGTAPAAGSPAADEIAGRRDVRPTADPAHEETEPPAASLFKSSETDQRNGHLYIDTAPLLLTFRDREDEPTGRPHRRGGRHRRSDSDAAG